MGGRRLQYKFHTITKTQNRRPSAQRGRIRCSWAFRPARSVKTTTNDMEDMVEARKCSEKRRATRGRPPLSGQRNKRVMSTARSDGKAVKGERRSDGRAIKRAPEAPFLSHPGKRHRHQRRRLQCLLKTDRSTNRTRRIIPYRMNGNKAKKNLTWRGTSFSCPFSFSHGRIRQQARSRRTYTTTGEACAADRPTGHVDSYEGTGFDKESRNIKLLIHVIFFTCSCFGRSLRRLVSALSLGVNSLLMLTSLV